MNRTCEHVLTALCAVLLLSTSSSHAKVTGSGGTVEFVAVGPAGLKITGRSTSITATEDAENVVITVPLAELDTGIGLRNQHMRDKYLDVRKYPNGILTVARSRLSLPAGGSGDVVGQLALHGTRRAVTVHYDARKDGGGYVVSGSMRIHMTDFGIEQPSFAGATVKPDVDVTVGFRVTDP